MADVINKETMKIYKSVNTPDYSELEFMIINSKTLPTCESKYWKIVHDEIVEMSTEEKIVIDYVPPIPEPEPLTIDELEKIRNANIAMEIAIKYPLSTELALNWKIHTGELTMDSSEIIGYLLVVTDAKLKYPKP